MKTILVKEAYQLYESASISVPEDATLESLVTTLARRPGVRGIFLIDSGRRVAGTITRSDLLKWARYRFWGEEGMKMIYLREIYQYIGATTAKDLAQGDRRSLGVKEDDTLYTALDRMISFGEDIIPVVDGKGRVLGDLTLSEVLMKAIEVERQSK
ncbi:MAG: CBS domain-containing protein [Dehalococcoidia bacterium]|nr:CBS domain-containing protein [Dehalococcoidia bacterium]